MLHLNPFLSESQTLDVDLLLEAAKTPWPPGTIRLMGKPGKEMYYIKNTPDKGDAWVYYAKPTGNIAPAKAAAIALQKTQDEVGAKLAKLFAEFPQLREGGTAYAAGVTPAAFQALGFASYAEVDTALEEPYQNALAHVFYSQGVADGTLKPAASPAASPAAPQPQEPVAPPQASSAPSPEAAAPSPPPEVVSSPPAEPPPPAPEAPAPGDDILALLTGQPAPAPAPTELPAPLLPPPAPADPFASWDKYYPPALSTVFQGMTASDAAELLKVMLGAIDGDSKYAGLTNIPAALVHLGLAPKWYVSVLDPDDVSADKAMVGALILNAQGAPPASLVTSMGLGQKRALAGALGPLDAYSELAAKFPNLGLVNPAMILGDGWREHLETVAAKDVQYTARLKEFSDATTDTERRSALLGLDLTNDAFILDPQAAKFVAALRKAFNADGAHSTFLRGKLVNFRDNDLPLSWVSAGGEAPDDYLSGFLKPQPVQDQWAYAARAGALKELVALAKASPENEAVLVERFPAIIEEAVSTMVHKGVMVTGFPPRFQGDGGTEFDRLQVMRGLLGTAEPLLPYYGDPKELSYLFAPGVTNTPAGWAAWANQKAGAAGLGPAFAMRLLVAHGEYVGNPGKAVEAIATAFREGLFPDHKAWIVALDDDSATAEEDFEFLFAAAAGDKSRAVRVAFADSKVDLGDMAKSIFQAYKAQTAALQGAAAPAPGPMPEAPAPEPVMPPAPSVGTSVGVPTPTPANTPTASPSPTLTAVAPPQVASLPSTAELLSDYDGAVTKIGAWLKSAKKDLKAVQKTWPATAAAENFGPWLTQTYGDDAEAILVASLPKPFAVDAALQGPTPALRRAAFVAAMVSLKGHYPGSASGSTPDGINTNQLVVAFKRLTTAYGGKTQAAEALWNAIPASEGGGGGKGLDLPVQNTTPAPTTPAPPSQPVPPSPPAVQMGPAVETPIPVPTVDPTPTGPTVGGPDDYVVNTPVGPINLSADPELFPAYLATAGNPEAEYQNAVKAFGYSPWDVKKLQRRLSGTALAAAMSNDLYAAGWSVVMDGKLDPSSPFTAKLIDQYNGSEAQATAAALVYFQGISAWADKAPLGDPNALAGEAPPTDLAPVPTSPTVTDTPENNPTVVDDPDAVELEQVGTYVPPMDQLTLVPGAGGALAGAHKKEVFEDKKGNRYIFRYAANSAGPAPFAPKVEALVSKLQRSIMPWAPPIVETTYNGKLGTIQPFAKVLKKPDLNPYAADPSKLRPNQIGDILAQHAVDWIAASHDGHPANFIRVDVGGIERVIGIDFGQAFKYWPTSKLATDYHPNAVYGESPPFTNTFWQAFANGKVDVPESAFAQMSNALDKLAAYPEAEYKAMLQAYYDALPPTMKSKFGPTFVDAANARRVNAKADFEKFISGLYKKRSGISGTFTFEDGWSPGVTGAAPGTVPGPVAPPPPATPPSPPVAVEPAKPTPTSGTMELPEFSSVPVEPVAAPKPLGPVIPVPPTLKAPAAPAAVPVPPPPPPAPLSPAEVFAKPIPGFAPANFAKVAGSKAWEEAFYEALKEKFGPNLPNTDPSEALGSPLMSWMGPTYPSHQMRTYLGLPTTTDGLSVGSLVMKNPATNGLSAKLGYGPAVDLVAAGHVARLWSSKLQMHVGKKTLKAMRADMDTYSYQSKSLYASLGMATDGYSGSPAFPYFKARVFQQLLVRGMLTQGVVPVETNHAKLQAFAQLAGFNADPKSVTKLLKGALTDPTGALATKLAQISPEWKALAGAYLTSLSVDEDTPGTAAWVKTAAGKLTKLGLSPTEATSAAWSSLATYADRLAAEKLKSFEEKMKLAGPTSGYAGTAYTLTPEDTAAIAGRVSLKPGSAAGVFDPMLATHLSGKMAAAIQGFGTPADADEAFVSSFGATYEFLNAVAEAAQTGKMPAGVAPATALKALFGDMASSAAKLYQQLAAAQASGDSTVVASCRDTLRSLAKAANPTFAVPAGTVNPFELEYVSPGTSGGESPSMVLKAPTGQEYLVVTPPSEEKARELAKAANKLAASIGIPSMGFGLVKGADGTPVAGLYREHATGTPYTPTATDKDEDIVAGLTALAASAMVGARLSTVRTSDGTVRATWSPDAVAREGFGLFGDLLSDTVADLVSGIIPSPTSSVDAAVQGITRLESLLKPVWDKAKAHKDVTVPPALHDGAKVSMYVLQRALAGAYKKAGLVSDSVPNEDINFGSLAMRKTIAGRALVSDATKKLASALYPAGSVEHSAYLFADGVLQGTGRSALAGKIKADPKLQELAAAFVTPDENGAIPKNTALIAASMLMGLAPPAPSYPNAKGPAVAYTPIGGMKSYEGVPTIDPKLPAKEHFEAMQAHPAIVAEGVLGLASNPVKAAHMASTVGPEWAKKYVVGHSLRRMTRKGVMSIADPTQRLTAAVRHLGSAILAHHRITTDFRGVDVPMDVRVALAREVLEAAGAPVSPETQLGTSVKVKVQAPLREVLIGAAPGTTKMAHLYKIVPGSAAGTYAVKLHASVGDEEAAKAYLESKGLQVLSIQKKTELVDGWTTQCAGAQLDAQVDLGEKELPLPEVTQEPDDPEDLIGLAVKWTPTTIQPNSSALENLSDLPCGESGFSVYADANVVEGQAIRVRRYKRLNGSVYHKVTFKCRPEALTTKEAEKNLSAAPTASLNLNHSSYDPASDAFQEAAGVTTLDGIAKLADAKLFQESGARMRVVPFTEQESAAEGLVEIDVEEGTDPSVIGSLLDKLDPTFSDRVLRDPTPEEKETLWLRRLLQYAAPKCGMLLRAASDEEVTLPRLRRLVSGDHTVFDELFPGKASSSGYVPNLAYGTSSATWATAFSETKSELSESTLLKPGTADQYDPDLHKSTGTGWHADTLEGAWKKLVEGKPATAVLQGLSGGGSNASTLSDILDSVFGLREDPAGNSDGGGVRGVMERFFQGKNVVGASASEDMASGSGDSTIARVWNGSISGSNEPMYADSASFVIRPEVLDRVDCYASNGDNYGAALGSNFGGYNPWESHQGLDKAGSWGTKNEIDFRKGIDHRAVMALCVKDPYNRKSLLDKLHAKGVHSLNGIPVESFIQGSITGTDVVSKLWPAFGVEAT